MSMWKHHGKLERHSLLLVIGIVLVVSIGGLVEIAPLFWIKNTIEKVEGVRPYTPLELAGRDIYIREGCYLCHSQMIRPLRDEVERYGHYSLAAESMYDHPFQWGSKRTGPDLARVGGKYSDSWHRDHLINPRSVVPESVMPPYAFLANKDLRTRDLKAKLEEFHGNLERAAVELARDWRTDRALRRLEALLVVASDKRSFLLSGTGDLIEPDDGLLAVGSGGPCALAAARALARRTELGAREIVEEALKIASEIDIYTNDRIVVEEL